MHYQILRGNIEYKYGPLDGTFVQPKDRVLIVEQVIDTIHLYDLEGDFRKAIGELTKKYKTYSKAIELRGDYIDGDTKKTLKFQHIKLEITGDPYEDEKFLQVVGIRKLDDTELVAFKKEEKKHQEENQKYMRNQYEQLKKQFEGE